jgi:hypothetical protein
MKTIVISCTFTFMLLAGTASAGPLTWAQVGNIDTLVQGGVNNDPQSGLNTEKTWIAGVLGIPVADLTYTQLPASTSNGDNWQQVADTTDIFAFDLGGDPSWFMVKVGAGGDGIHYLFDNSDNEQYAVIDFDEFGFDKIEIGKISHVGIADGIGGDGNPGELTPVPEPASLTLLGAGLAAVGARFRRRKQQVQ